MADATLRVFRGGPEGGETADYRVPVAPGMVVPSRGTSSRISPCAGTARRAGLRAALLHEDRARTKSEGAPALRRPPHTVTVLFEEAMNCFEQAERIRPEGNDDAILRWNRCVRLLQSRSASDWQREIEAFDASDSPPV